MIASALQVSEESHRSRAPSNAVAFRRAGPLAGSTTRVNFDRPGVILDQMNAAAAAGGPIRNFGVLFSQIARYAGSPLPSRWLTLRGSPGHTHSSDGRIRMRTLAGAVLIAVAEQAFAHGLMIRFPNHLFASEVLLPSSAVLLFLGVSLLIWGVLTDFRKPSRSDKSEEPDSSGAPS